MLGGQDISRGNQRRRRAPPRDHCWQATSFQRRRQRVDLVVELSRLGGEGPHGPGLDGRHLCLAVLVPLRHRVARHSVPLRPPRGHAGDCGRTCGRQRCVRVADADSEHLRDGDADSLADTHAFAVAELQPLALT